MTLEVARIAAASTAFAAAIGFFGPRALPYLGALESHITDLRAAALSSPEPQHPDIVIAAITEDTLGTLPYRSPIDRRFLARLLTALDQAGARAVGLDILFDQATETDKDAELGSVLRAMKAKVVAAYADRSDNLTSKQSAFLDAFLQGVGKGYVAFATDPLDGAVRRIDPGRGRADMGGAARVPAFATALAHAVGAGAPSEPMAIAYRPSPGNGQPAFRSFAAHTIPILPKAWFQNKIVLVGADQPHSDRFPSPFARPSGYGDTLPGVVVHAHVLSQFLDARRAAVPGIAGELATVLVASLLGLLLAAAPIAVPLKLAAGLVGVAAWWAGSLVLFKATGVPVPLIPPSLAFGVAVGAGSFYLERRERTRRKFISGAFGRYLSPEVVKRLSQNPEALKLGGEQRELTVLFLDVRGFTSISDLFTPVGLTELMNKLLTPLTEAILRHGGTVDKYMGDAIMAFWNAPLEDAGHARNACLAALAMTQAMGPLNESLEAEARAQGRKHIRLKVGIGLNSGPAVVGNMGSDQRFDYSCLGDTVNTASRLEGQSKGYGVAIVLGPATADSVPDLATIPLDLIKVKGKTQAVKIHALLGDRPMKGDPAFADFARAHAEMLAGYWARRWPEAAEKLSACRRLSARFADLEGFYDLYAERLRAYAEDPPPDDWDGAFVAKTK